MTSTEAATRKPTAKEIAENAEALAEQANSTAQQVLTELRELRESGGPTGGGTDPSIVERVNNLDKDVEGLLENLNELASRLQASAVPPMGGDGKPLDLATVVVEFQKALKTHAETIDANHAAARDGHDALAKRIEHEIAQVRDLLAGYGDQPPGRHSMAALDQDMHLIRERLDTIEHSGVADASAEDVSALDSRLQAIEHWAANTQLQTATGNPQVRTSQAPVRAGGVPAVYGQVHELMKRVTEIGKDKQADQKMGGYRFRSIDAAMDAVGHALREVGLMFLPGEILDKRVERYTTEQVFSNGDSRTLYWTHVWVTQRYRFQSLIDGSLSEPFEMDGEARDNGDKSTSKADSMRMKYALLQALCIPIQGLPESDGRDGTEARNDDPWSDAPPIGNGQGHADEPPHQPEGTQPSGPAQQDDVPPQVKAEAAVASLKRLASLPPDQRRPEFQRIADKVRQLQLGGIMVEGATVNMHLTATNSNLGAS